MSKISTRLAAIEPSATLAVTQKTGELRAKGIDVIGFSAGEPDFATPQHIIEAAKAALDAGATRYTPAAGTVALKRAVAAQNERVRKISTSDEQVIICTGAKHVLYNFFMAVLDVGDEVLIPSPFYVSYPDQVRLAGGIPVMVPTFAHDNWVMDPSLLEKAVTSRSKVLLLNSPSNPTGGLYNRDQMKAVVDKAISLGLYVISDEIYRDLVYDDHEFVSAMYSPDVDMSRIFIVDGVSKTYAMTGWRIGWGIGDPEIVAAMTKIQGQAITNPTAISQEAALAAVEGPLDFLPGWKQQYQARRDAFVAGLNAIDGMECKMPPGAFYVFPDVTQILPKMAPGSTDIDFAKWLLENANVAVVPGTPFGAPGYIRLAYATSMELIIEGLSRMTIACRKL
ncbi:MAG: pyridoxal phosphate-dependent aminotransferase [Deltaproteobacteria bacterium]|nr:pyridoxal phosphate-dependent aminotransferase [Deltaproteobacteria bacterium]